MSSRAARPAMSVFVLVATVLGLLTVAGGAPRRANAAGGDRVGFAPGSMILWGSDADLARDLDAMVATGATWLRVDFDWPSIEPNQGQFNWSHTDRVVNAAQQRGMRILALPTYTPAWARPAGTGDKTPPTDPATFANFVQAAVARYAPRGVKSWEIWNEPNISMFWAPRPDAAAYTRLLIGAAAAVHGTDPTATVLSGGLSPATDSSSGSSIAPTTFISRIYDAGAKGSFDAVAIHPYSYPALPTQSGTDSWNTFLRMSLIHDLMVAKGDGAKLIWSTEVGAPTGTGSGAVSEDQQAAIASDAIRAIAQRPWAGPLFWYAMRDAGTDPADREQNFGLIRNDFTPKKSLATFTATVASVFGAPVTVPPTPTTVPLNTNVIRLSGRDRIETAIEVSRRRVSADRVVIATTRTFADALVGGPLAANVSGPVLLTGPDGLDPRVAAELQRLGATRAIVLGGPAALSPAVEDALGRLGVASLRIAGADRYETAAMVADAIGPSDTVLVASGTRFPDALSAGALGLPVLLTDRDVLPEASRLRLADRNVVVVGGAAAVAPGVVPETLRLAGDDRYATSAAVADWGTAEGRYLDDGVVVTRGDDYADALVGGPLRLPLLLVGRDSLDASPATRDWLVAHAPIDPAVVLGGSSALSPTTQADLDRAFAGLS